METMTYNEKIAVVKVLNDIIIADNVKEERELELKKRILLAWDLPQSAEEDAENCPLEKAVSIIKGFNDEKKAQLTKLMGSMIVVDKNINYKEVEFYNRLCVMCEINNKFEIEEYPDCTYSGPEPAEDETGASMDIEEYKRKAEEYYKKRYPWKTHEDFEYFTRSVTVGWWEQYMEDFSPEVAVQGMIAGLI